KYKVNDDSRVNCTLQFNNQGSWWQDQETHTHPEKNKEKEFAIKDIKEGEYKYRIMCIDSEKNYGFSETRTFYVKLTENSGSSSASSTETKAGETKNEIISSFMAKLEQISSGFEKLPKNEQEVIAIIKLNEKIQDAQKKLGWYERDLNNLIWRNLGEAELKQEEGRIYSEIEAMKEDIPSKLNVVDTLEFVAYPSEEEIQNIILEYLDSESSQYTKSTKNAITEKNKNMQKLLTVTTKAKIINVEYISGKTGKITLVEKILEIDQKSEKYSDSLFLIESIPKEFAESAKEFVFLFEHNIVKDDPLIKISNTNLPSFAYYLKRGISLNTIKNTKTLIVDDNPERAGNIITGFNVFTDMKPAFIDSANTRIIIEIIIIIVLFVIYLGYSVKTTKIRYLLFNRKSIKNIDEIKEKIEKATNELVKGDYNNAKSIYSEIQPIFSEISHDLKKEVYKDIIILSNKLDLFYINDMIDDANESVDDGNIKKAIEKYNKVRQLYSSLGPKHKQDIINKCSKLIARISEKNGK
ncbi:MAG: hypothetical protein PHV16_01505, partial [Candidatus Nanoarchaeia archaeon]|nr:hypothetical protein [Candidatus Nanoarchaeia archaeon]